MLLILAGTYNEAADYVQTYLGVSRDKWHFIIDYRDMIRFRNSSVHIVGSARGRADFEAIQGLFILGEHDVLDTEADG